jgi:protein gp37
VATRGADLYPGLAVKKGDSYAFNGKILLLPERLGTPMLNRTPTRYFVNSMSDLFHKDVPEGFISAIFDVMEKAPWHTFQVLTKRPERMAVFTQKRYRDRAPRPNIWLGTSTENQECFDKRSEHLRQVKAAVRWLSCEPLLGAIKLSSTADIEWVVAGGESKGGRPMDKKWAASLRDQCKKAGIPFFFKQWGDFNEEGAPQKEKKDGGAKLDGKIHHEYPTPG